MDSLTPTEAVEPLTQEEFVAALLSTVEEHHASTRVGVDPPELSAG